MGGFTSYERDSHSGTDYAVNRHYANVVGCFHSADPFKPSADATKPQSWNRYAYVMNAPIDSIDPLGLLRKETEIGDPCGAIGDGFFPDPIESFFGGILTIGLDCDTSKIAIVPGKGKGFQGVQGKGLFCGFRAHAKRHC